jgi:hypothetical protein
MSRARTQTHESPSDYRRRTGVRIAPRSLVAMLALALAVPAAVVALSAPAVTATVAVLLAGATVLARRVEADSAARVPLPGGLAVEVALRAGERR